MLESEQSAEEGNDGAQQRPDAEYQHIAAVQIQSPDGFSCDGTEIQRNQFHVYLLDRFGGRLRYARSANTFRITGRLGCWLREVFLLGLLARTFLSLRWGSRFGRWLGRLNDW